MKYINIFLIIITFVLSVLLSFNIGGLYGSLITIAALGDDYNDWKEDYNCNKYINMSINNKVNTQQLNIPDNNITHNTSYTFPINKTLEVTYIEKGIINIK